MVLITFLQVATLITLKRTSQQTVNGCLCQIGPKYSSSCQTCS